MNEKQINIQELIKRKAEIIERGTFEERFEIIKYYCTIVEYYLNAQCPITAANKNAILNAVYNGDNADEAMLLYRWLCAHQVILPTARRLDTIVAKQIAKAETLRETISRQNHVKMLTEIATELVRSGVSAESIQAIFNANHMPYTIEVQGAEVEILLGGQKAEYFGQYAESLSTQLYKDTKMAKMMIEGIRQYYSDMKMPIPAYFASIYNDARSISASGIVPFVYNEKESNRVTIYDNLFPNYDKLRVTTDAKKVTKVMYREVDKIMKQNLV
jgi:hypothetical protein